MMKITKIIKVKARIMLLFLAISISGCSPQLVKVNTETHSGMSSTNPVQPEVSVSQTIETFQAENTDVKDTSDVQFNDPTNSNSGISDMMHQVLNLAQAESDKKITDIYEDYEKADIPLIAAIPDKEVYLYGIKSGGIAIYYSGKVFYLNRGYLTPRFILPRMCMADFDKDGKEELAIILYTGSGTGVSFEELHILEFSQLESAPEIVINTDNESDNKYMKAYSFMDYVDQLENEVKIAFFKENDSVFSQVTIGNKQFTDKISDDPDDIRDIKEDALHFGSILYFNFENGKLTANFALGMLRHSFAAPDFIGDVTAEVVYDSGQFRLVNLAYEAFKYSVLE